ncbi:calmodulin-binding protein-like protein Sha1 [Plenodomus tracheiphilus IPT5]|uniref:Calmodulin-binding protein-like protein Sha1 n=1 Tax=Plenodomus tracheiphilus IPT5 TaxID=1408161 RepID=A0A6A7B4M0_9PLEO|nr:calmodulin-binding protein-like protein Sha1 [Plenodomus tracheiphilus IPT5]
MYRYTAGTPCPAPQSSYAGSYYSDYGYGSSSYAPSYAPDDTTANIEYTTELKADARPRQAKPRRPVRNTHKPAFNPTLDIFEDVAQEEEQQQQADLGIKRRSRASVMPDGARTKRSTILSHPAQKIPKPAAPRVQEPQPEKPQRRRVSHALSERHVPDANATVQLREDLLEKNDLKKQGPKKDPRRRTIYIPSDDTTMVTIHPGQSTHAPRNPRENSPDIGLDLVTLSEEEGNNLLPALKKEKKAPRKSLAVPPKRGPLSTSSRSTQSVSFSSDVVGQGGGKENLPPGLEILESKGNGTHHIEINFSKAEPPKPAAKSSKVHFNGAKEVDRTHSTKKRPEGTQKRVRPHTSTDDAPAKAHKARADGTASMASSRASLHTTIKAERAKMARTKRVPLSSSPFSTNISPPTALRRQRTEQAPVTMMHVVGKRPQVQEKYPVLGEDLAQPELYEDNWLTYQEVAITQLLNSVFDKASNDPNAEQSPADLRKKMLSLYHDPSMPPLHKRLQASLQYGALSIPKDLLAQTLRLKDDVGLRKKFLNLWTKSYDLNALRAAAETITGRQITTPCRLSTGSTMSDDGSRQYRAERRAIETFLDTFLIKNEDAVRVKSGGGSIASLTRGDDDFGSQGWSWRRTALRSLMLVLLLDKAKTTDALPGCLFQSTSAHKTSVEVLHQLSHMLLPSLGDITRPLGHLTYKVEHVQYPLQEYTYHIDNIAIDLRDGITLTRLVELLLYSPSTLVAQNEDTVAIAMPTGELLTSSFDFAQKESWVLSQHLKYPAIGRPQKVYNVQIALAALRGAQGVPSQAVSGIRAEEIVDGHREKTLSLLWSLVGKCGLGQLVDWPQIVKETERFRLQWYRNRDNFAGRDLDSDDDDLTTELDGLAYHKRALLSWSRSIARLQGLRVSNLTTSFADPRVLEAIVDKYLPSTLSVDGKFGLATKLRAVGCSASFISLFTPNHNTPRSIPSRDFTLLSLAFLASRLLPLSKTHRAASTIQKAFRKHIARRQTHQRIALLKVAHEAAVVAQARQRLVDAATVVQQRWRAVLDKRQRQLESDVLAFQALARGWAIRRWVRRITAGRVGGKEKVRRVRGGW